MADHTRKQIRAAIGVALTGLDSTGAHCFVSRIRPLQASELPALRVYADDETAQLANLDETHVYDRTVSIKIEVIAKATAALDDVLDQISKEVEVKLSAGITLQSKKLLPIYVGGQADFDDSGDQPVGKLVMSYNVEYSAADAAPDVLI